MNDATFDETPTAELPLDFTRLQRAAVSYEQQYAPHLWQLRQQAEEDWQTLARQLQAGIGTKTELSGLQTLLADWTDAQALQAALLETPLPLLEACCQQLKANTNISNDSPPTLASLLLNLIEAHCFGSVVARAPAEMARALQALQTQSLVPLRVLTPDLPAFGTALPPWLEQLPSETLSRLREACYMQLQPHNGPDRPLFEWLLVCLNSMLILRQLD